MNALYAEKRVKYTPEMIVSDPQTSVNASVDYLHYLRKRFPTKPKIGILHNYGGAGEGGSTDVAQRVSQWLKCEQILQGARGEFYGKGHYRSLNRRRTESRHADSECHRWRF